MSTQIVPAASLRNAKRLPAARTRSSASNYLICMALLSIGRAIFGVASNFVPALRERCRLPGGVEQGADHLRALFPVMLSDSSVPAAADRASGGPPGRATPMTRGLRGYFMAAGLLGAVLMAEPASAQKPGGVLRMPIGNSPASMSIHEEATRIAVTPMMAVFNNLVLFDQHVAQNTFESIRPDLAESWSWDEDKTALTFRLRTGVKWHDGTPFTAKDVKCTWDTLAGRSSDKLRVNPRKSWYRKLAEVTVDGDNEVTFHLQRPQPSLLALLASGASPVYPCHVPPAQMRQHPIGTGPFKFVEFKPNESVRLTRNPDYWKPGRPYLDGLEFPIVASVATRNLMFIADNVDMTLSYGVSMPLLRDIKSQVSEAICTTTTDNGARNLIINPVKPPFDNAELRRAVSLTLDRKAFVDILVEERLAVERQ